MKITVCRSKKEWAARATAEARRAEENSRRLNRATVEATRFAARAWMCEDFADWVEATAEARRRSFETGEPVAVVHEAAGLPEGFDSPSVFGSFFVDSRRLDDVFWSRYELGVPGSTVAFIVWPDDQIEMREVCFSDSPGAEAYTTTALSYRTTAERQAQESELRRIYGGGAKVHLRWSYDATVAVARFAASFPAKVVA